MASELKLTETAVRAWVKRADIDDKKDPNGPLTSDERAEVTRLRSPGASNTAPVNNNGSGSAAA